MSTETVFLKGKFIWCQHIRPDTAFEPHSWRCGIFPDAESLEKIKVLKKAGLQNHLKLDDDGQQFMSFKRTTEKTVRGQKQGMVPPYVIDKQGVPIHVPVGNGSDGIMELEVYSHKTQQPGVTKKAARWVGNRLDNFVPYEVTKDTPDGGASTEAIRAVPEQFF